MKLLRLDSVTDSIDLDQLSESIYAELVPAISVDGRYPDSDGDGHDLDHVPLD